MADTRIYLHPSGHRRGMGMGAFVERCHSDEEEVCLLGLEVYRGDGELAHRQSFRIGGMTYRLLLYEAQANWDRYYQKVKDRGDPSLDQQTLANLQRELGEHADEPACPPVSAERVDAIREKYGFPQAWYDDEGGPHPPSKEPSADAALWAQYSAGSPPEHRLQLLTKVGRLPAEAAPYVLAQMQSLLAEQREFFHYLLNRISKAQQSALADLLSHGS